MSDRKMSVKIYAREKIVREKDVLEINVREDKLQRKQTSQLKQNKI